MEVKTYNDLPEEAVRIREEIFVKEQGFQDEFDETDRHCIHLVLFEGEIPIATSRFFPSEDEDEYILGRFAVIKEKRGQNLGSNLIRLTEEEVRKLGGKKARLHAQVRATGFYEKNGYEKVGETDFEEGVPHIWMRKDL